MTNTLAIPVAVHVRGKQPEGKLHLSHDRKVSPEGKLQESRMRWVPSVPNGFGLPAGESCPGKTEFCRSCYAITSENSKGVGELVRRNLHLLLAAGSIDAMAELISEMLGRYWAFVERRKLRKIDWVFRIHWDGDFFSEDYARAWAIAMARFPQVRFWAYTRSFVDSCNVVPILVGVPNLVLYLSTDTQNVELAKRVYAENKGIMLAACTIDYNSGRDMLAGLDFKVCPENDGSMHEDLPQERVQALATDLKLRIATFQSDYSRFLETSYIGRLNSDSQLSHPPMELIKIIKAAEQLREQTNGRFNVGVGSVLENLGYDAQYHLTEQGETSKVGGSVFVELTPELIQIQSGARVDLGGIGKGWLIDILIRQLDQAGLRNYFVNGGGDIAVNSPGQPFKFALENPFDSSQAIGEIELEQGGIGGSSANRRQWKSTTSGQTHHHIIDPSTGASHPGPAAVFTFGDSATAADVAATILFLTPPAEIADMAKTLKVEYLIIEHSGGFSRSEAYPGKLFA